MLSITKPRNFLYYDATEAITQIDGLRKSAQAFLNDIEKLNSQLSNALLKEMKSTHSKKSILGKAGPMPTVRRTSFFVHALQKVLINQQEIYELSQFPGIQRGKGRPRNQFAHDVATGRYLFFSPQTTITWNWDKCTTFTVPKMCETNFYGIDSKS